MLYEFCVEVSHVVCNMYRNMWGVTVFFRWLRNRQKPYEQSSATSAATARTTQTCQTASRSDAPRVHLTDGGSISTPEWWSRDTLLLLVGINSTRTTSPWKENSWSSEWKCINSTLDSHIISSFTGRPSSQTEPAYVYLQVTVYSHVENDSFLQNFQQKKKKRKFYESIQAICSYTAVCPIINIFYCVNADSAITLLFSCFYFLL